MRINIRPAPFLGFCATLAPHLSKAKKETLLRGIAVDLFSGFAVESIFERHVGDPKPAVICRVLPERQLAVQMHIAGGNEAAVLLVDTAYALLILFGVF